MLHWKHTNCDGFLESRARQLQRLVLWRGRDASPASHFGEHLLSERQADGTGAPAFEGDEHVLSLLAASTERTARNLVVRRPGSCSTDERPGIAPGQRGAANGNTIGAERERRVANQPARQDAVAVATAATQRVRHGLARVLVMFAATERPPFSCERFSQKRAAARFAVALQGAELRWLP